MVRSPTLSQCPTYVPATQITPDSIDEMQTQQQDFLTQDDQRLLFHDENSSVLSINAEDSPPKKSKHSCRDYYDQLFSSDSDSENSSSSFNQKSDSNSQEPSSDMSISDSDLSEDDLSVLQYQFEPIVESHNNKSLNAPIPTMNVNHIPNPAELSSEEQDELLGYNQSIPKLMTQETSPDTHTDKIATFNIKNQYDHNSAAELMIKEDLTYIAFQEPFASCNAPAESWQSYSKCELQSARIDCYQTKHQIILVDTFKWGGKIIANFESFLGGRLTGIAFRFSNGKALGIISVYISSAEIHHNTATSINAQILEHIKDLSEKWTNNITNIDIIIIGDFQETCTISNRDNVGKFRKPKECEGVLSFLEDTHESFIRKVNCNQNYITRFGDVGGRGIDHIMLPQCDDVQALFPKAYIARDEGATYFPSDHSMLICEYSRCDQNNNEDGQATTKWNYADIYNIKVTRSGDKGRDIKLDMSQFKDSDKFRRQAQIYKKLQEATSDQASLTDYHITPLETKVEELTQSLWKKGIIDNVDGPNNKLVSITEEHALEISIIYRKFRRAIHEIMESLELSHEKDNLASAGTTRGNLRKTGGFRMFRNLPIPSKLRYLRTALLAKAKLIQKAQLLIKEMNICEMHGIEQNCDEKFWNTRDKIVKTNTLQSHASSISTKINAENVERDAHICAINFQKNQKSKKMGKNIVNPVEKSQKENFLPHISESISQLLNSWLKEAKCDQKFNTLPLSKWYETLSKDITSWKIPLTEFHDCGPVSKDSDLRERINESLSMSSLQLKAIIQKVNRIQVKYRMNTLLYFLKVNTIDAFTRKVLYKQRSAPMTHSTIWDEKLQSQRPCTSEVEELQATQEFHGHWMGNTKASENCAFAKVISKGRLGPRGIKLFPDRKLSMEDIPKLIHNGNKLSRKVKRAFLAAHNKHTAKLFKAPASSRKEFFYPFYLRTESGIMNRESQTEEKMWTSLASIPCKARHAGFQMATLGRFGSKWRNLFWKIIKLMLIMRYIPNDLKKIARYPIPKPGKRNEYRPISLCNDVYCFLNGIITEITSAAIEKVMLLHKGITSYRQGKSCATLVTVEQCFREDCIEKNLPTVQIDEDEEKFFDRVCLEIILSSMRINGFPESGFIEFKACMMGEKIVEIITCKGTAFAKFVCGLEQGNPDSPTIANLVIKMKHDVWRTMSDELRDLLQRDKNGNCDRYRFYICDKDDGEVWVYMMGYCDDNTKFLQAADENDLLPLVQRYVQLSGDLSMVTKIGRKSSKCEIQFYNISAKLTIRLQKCWSTAWSFIHDAPIEEQVPFKVYLQSEELKEFYKLSGYNDLTQDEKEKWDKIVTPKAHKHLGLSATLSADTSTSGIATIRKIYDRLAQLKIRHMELEAQRKCSNMLLATITAMHRYR